MRSYFYETHIMKNPLLPFIFHKDTTVYRNNISNWHENIEILVGVSGEGYIQYDTEQFSFSAGEIIVINSDCLHATRSDTQLIYHCLIIDKTFCESNGIATSDICFQKLIRDPKLNKTFQLVVDSFDNYEKNTDPFSVAQVRYRVLGFLCQLCQDHIVEPEISTASISSERVKKAIVYIRQHLSESISLQQISDHVGISKYHLSREFKTNTGSTVFDTINLIRCAEAKRLIEQGMSVSSAAISCGFENLSYFSRTFKKHFGDLPSHYLQY